MSFPQGTIDDKNSLSTSTNALWVSDEEEYFGLLVDLN